MSAAMLVYQRVNIGTEMEVQTPFLIHGSSKLLSRSWPHAAILSNCGELASGLLVLFGMYQENPPCLGCTHNIHQYSRLCW